MFGSDVMAAGIGYEGQKETNASNARQAQIQMEWQKTMSDTAHQRESKDLAAAGLNRILSVSKGGPGASTPPGAAATMGNPFDAAARTLGSAQEYARNKQERQIGDEVLAQEKQKTLQEEKNTDIKEVERYDASARWNYVNQNRIAENRRFTAEAQTAENEAGISSAEASRRRHDITYWDSGFGQAARLSELGASTAGAVLENAGKVLPLNRALRSVPSGSGPGDGFPSPSSINKSRGAATSSAGSVRRMPDVIDPETGEILRRGRPIRRSR